MKYGLFLAGQDELGCSIMMGIRKILADCGSAVQLCGLQYEWEEIRNLLSDRNITKKQLLTAEHFEELWPEIQNLASKLELEEERNTMRYNREGLERRGRGAK